MQIKKSPTIINSTIQKAIDDSIALDAINREKQEKHLLDNHIIGRSYLNGDLSFAENLYKEFRGKGKPIFDKNGNWTRKELVGCGRIIGIRVSENSQEESSTIKIHYSKTGSHIVPR